MFHDNQHVLPYWIQQMTKVIHHLGKDNVFVSILESHSKDSTPALLEAFDLQLAALGVPRRIIVRDNSIPRPSKMDTEPPRIEFLAASRNKVLEPLLEKGGYQRVLFSNDVFVEADSVLDLLGTRDGNYDMACGIDLAYWGMYDAWVLRDRLGRIASSLWPYLFDDEGKQAVMNDEPAAVFSCWNGIVAFRADPVLPDHLRNVSNLTLAPLKFRASTQDECFSSESFNFPYDLRRRFNMNEIYMNPRVITSYQWRLYFWFKYVVRHWLIVWWMKHWEAGSGMLRARTIIGDEKGIWTWDGGECQPWPKKV
ncbi:cryptococcal mannosyltransferase 1-domain-containing protein [Mycena floridula]|nr:cryptococcal mannosyltransferase 1-domain-containing protein [Mycena floridula]